MKFLKNHLPLMLIAAAIFLLPVNISANHVSHNYPSNEPVTEIVKDAFSSDFKNARAVTWTQIGNVYQASFTNDELALKAYYSEVGELLGTGRYVEHYDLPVLVAIKLSEKFWDLSIKRIIEYSSRSEGTLYYVRMENEKAGKLVRINAYNETEEIESYKLNKK